MIIEKRYELIERLFEFLRCGGCLVRWFRFFQLSQTKVRDGKRVGEFFEGGRSFLASFIGNLFSLNLANFRCLLFYWESVIFFFFILLYIVYKHLFLLRSFSKIYEIFIFAHKQIDLSIKSIKRTFTNFLRDQDFIFLLLACSIR